MNDTISVAEKHEELIQRRSEFPIDFEPGAPFGLSESATVTEDGEESQGQIVAKDTLAELLSLSELAPMTKRFLDTQMEHWLTILEKMPDNPHVLNNIGTTYLSKGDVERAKMYFKKALETDKDFRPARANLARVHSMEGKFDEALAIYLEDEKKWPEDTRVLMNMASLYLKQGKLEPAKDKLKQVLSFEPDNSAAYHNRGIIHLMNHKVNEAISDFRKALAFNERSAITYNALATCYMLRRAYQKAIKYFSISLTLDTSSITTLRNLASVHRLAGHFAEAVRLMEKYLVTYPMDVDARDIAAFSYLKMKQYKQSLAHLEYVRKNWQELALKEEELARICNNIGVVRSYLQQFTEAIGMYKSSIELYREKALAIPYANLVKVYLVLGKLRDAETLAEEYIGEEPSNYLPLILLANYYYYNDEYDRARQMLSKVLENDENNIDALTLLTCIYGEVLQDLDKALELATKAQELKPASLALRNNLAYFYLRKGCLSEAKEVLEDTRWPKDYFFSYATKGLLRIAEGDISEGARLYEEAERLAQQTEWKRLVRQKKHVELARYHLARGENEKAKQELSRVLSIKAKQQLYGRQAQELLMKI